LQIPSPDFVPQELAVQSPDKPTPSPSKPTTVPSKPGGFGDVVIAGAARQPLPKEWRVIRKAHVAAGRPPLLKAYEK